MNIEVIVDNALGVFCNVNNIRHINSVIRDSLVDYLSKYVNEFGVDDLYAIAMGCLYFIQELVDSFEENEIRLVMNKFFSLDTCKIQEYAKSYLKK